MTTRPTTARPRSTTARTLALGVVLAIGLTGCGGGDGGSGGGGGAGTGAGGDRDGYGDASGPREAPVGIIDELLRNAAADWDEEESNRQQMQVQELVAECMAGLGFEYIPVDYSLPDESDEADEADGGPVGGTREYAEKWGYGITSLPTSGTEGTADVLVDPNTAITEAMKEGERAAYDEALWGPPVDETGAEEEAAEATEYVEPPWEEMGCSGAAHHEVYGDGLSEAENPFADLQEEMRRMGESVSADARMLAVTSDWVSCMADAGHPGFTKTGDGRATITAQVDAVWAEVSANASPDATEEDYRAADTWVTDQLAQIHPQEIEMAVDDHTCREGLGYDDVYNEVNVEVQQRFYDAHKADVEAWVAYLQEQ